MAVKRPRGTNDFLPEDTAKWQYVEQILRDLCKDYGYEEIRTPIFEHTELFQRGVGDTTDIVQKEMYTFEDSGGRSITLRPENTAAAARAYIEDKLFANTQPTKLYYLGPMFRYERPQAGRFRQFHQFGAECFGTDSPAADAEIIALAWEFYRRLGLKGLEVHLNSVGCPNCRPLHREQLQRFLRPRYEELCDTCKGRFEKNPLRILDCKSPVCQELTQGAPTTLDCLCDDCKAHFAAVQQYLDAAGIPYTIDNRLVRGLDYYTNTAFEIHMDGIGAQSAVCGGGRYNGLLQEIGDRSIPGVGYAQGMERVFSCLEVQNIEIPVNNHKEVFIATLGEAARVPAFCLLNQLREQGVRAEMDLLERSLKAQMKYADKYHVQYTVILGEDEIAKGVACVRDMSDSSQTEISLEQTATVLLEHLKENQAK